MTVASDERSGREKGAGEGILPRAANHLCPQNVLADETK